MTTTPKKRGRPEGWTKPGGRRQRRDYRFTPDTLARIEQGRKLATCKDETDFVEQAITHYVSRLTRKDVPETSCEEVETLRQENQRLWAEAKNVRLTIEVAQSYHQEVEILRAQLRKYETDAKKPEHPSRPKKGGQPTIIVPDLRLTATNWASFWLHWQQDGLEAIATLEPVDGRSSASGYRLDSLCQSIARPGQALGTRQEKRSWELKRLARARMIAELEQAGWKPDDQEHPETTIWRYRPIRGSQN